MSFPDRSYEEASAFAQAYIDKLVSAWKSVDGSFLDAAAAILEQAYTNKSMVFVCGNGGSSSISNHLVCDHLKGIQTDTDIRPRVMSLTANTEIITAIANDISYNDVFVYQLSTIAQPDDVLITISASGNSENIVRAATWAKKHDLRVISMTGFSGGRSSKIADVNLHVDSDNYGIVEDMHQSLMHILAQFLRLHKMPSELVKKRLF